MSWNSLLSKQASLALAAPEGDSGPRAYNRARKGNASCGSSWENRSNFFFLAKKKTNKKKTYFHRLPLGESHAKQGAFGSSDLERKYWMSENFFFFFYFGLLHYKLFLFISMMNLHLPRILLLSYRK